eukprot:g2954.t1
MGDSGTDGELTYWEGRYGGFSSSSSGYGGGGGYGSAYGGPPAIAFIPTYAETDKALAWCRLVLAGAFIPLGTFALAVMFRWRYVLDIRARSVNLVLLSGASIVTSYLVAVNEALMILWGPEYSLDWLWPSLLLFFITPTVFVSYVFRALRLAVVFHPKAKRHLRWLIPERNHVVFLLVMGVGFLAIPIRQHYTLQPWEVIPKQVDILATVSLIFAASLACIYPFIRRVDDLFNISKELVIVTALLLILSVGLKCVQWFDNRMLDRWIGRNWNFIISAAVFGVSVVDPLRRLARDPMAITKRNGSERLFLARRSGRSTAHTLSSAASDCEDPGGGEVLGSGATFRALACLASGSLEDGEGYLDGSRLSAVTPAVAAAASVAALSSSSALARPPGADDLSPSPEPGEPEAGNWVYQGISFSSQPNGCCGGGGGGGGGGDRGYARRSRVRDTIESWNFERLSRTPMLAAAFDSFSRKALCHESVLFLSEVSRYESGDFSEPSGLEGPSQYEAFCRITDLFVRPGSREEVNISGEDRRRILDWTHKGEARFAMQAEAERRMIFRRAYQEVKSMLEDNLLRRFLQTEEFRAARAQRNNITTMVSTPNGLFGVVRRVERLEYIVTGVEPML